MNELLRDRVVNRLEACLGARLRSVRYWLLSSEAECGWDYGSANSYFGGELELTFSNEENIFITWEEQNVWPDHFSIQVRADTAFRKDHLMARDGSSLSFWRPLVGSSLQNMSVHGWNATPQVLKLDFAAGSIYVGTGHKRNFGGGDDVLVRPEESPFDLSGSAKLWQS